jgi:predicted CopG family antitoxin
MPTYATIQVRPATKRMLEKAKENGESFDSVIRRKLKEAQQAAEKAFWDELDARFANRATMKPLR